MDLLGWAAILTLPVTVFVTIFASRSSFGAIARIKRIHDIEQITPDTGIELTTLKAARKQLTRQFAISQAIVGRRYRWWTLIPAVVLAVISVLFLFTSDPTTKTAASAILGAALAMIAIAVADLIRTRRAQVKSRAQFDAILRKVEGDSDPFAWSKGDSTVS